MGKFQGQKCCRFVRLSGCGYDVPLGSLPIKTVLSFTRTVFNCRPLGAGFLDRPVNRRYRMGMYLLYWFSFKFSNTWELELTNRQKKMQKARSCNYRPQNLWCANQIQRPKASNTKTVYNWSPSAVAIMKMVNAKVGTQNRKLANKDCKGMRKGRARVGSCWRVIGMKAQGLVAQGLVVWNAALLLYDLVPQQQIRNQHQRQRE